MKGREHSRGFTLLELLVAVTITLLLVGLILSVTTSVLNLWRRTQGGFGATTGAKLALDLIERDLHGALYRRDGGTWLAVTVLNDLAGLGNRGWITTGTRLKPATAESLRLLPTVDAAGEQRLRDARFGLSGAWLRFIAANVESGGSLPIAVAYQLARRPLTGSVVSSNPAPVRYTLFRSTVAAGTTFTSGYNVDAAAYTSASNSPGAQRAGSTIANPVTLDALATNVLDFGLWLYARNPDGTLRRIYPASNGDLGHSALGLAAPADANRMPEVADVMLRILSEAGAAQIENIESGRITRPPQYASDAEWWWAVAEANSRVSVRRVLIEGTAP